MNLENQVTSLALSQRLRELGVKQESLFIWSYYPHIDGFHPEPEFNPLGLGVEQNGLNISAFTVAELGEMLPAYIDLPHGRNDATLKLIKYNSGYGAYYQIGADEPDYHQQENTLADCLAKMLIYLLENDLIKNKS